MPAIEVSTHDLTKRSTRPKYLYQFVGEFQLTTSRRGRLNSHCPIVRFAKCFNSRPHEEVDDRSLGFVMSYGHRFNSRPHEEVDGKKIEYVLCKRVSTHDLTKRSTAIFTQKVFLSKSLFVLIAYNIFILH